MTVGVMIIVAMLALALIMLSTSQMFIVQTQKKELQGFYAAEAQILWVAHKIQSDPDYRGGTNNDGEAESTYSVEGAEEVVIDVTDDGNLIDLNAMAVNPGLDEATDIFTVKAYVKFSGTFGKKESAVRLDAIIERRVKEVSVANFEITTQVKEWKQVKPPQRP